VEEEEEEQEYLEQKEENSEAKHPWRTTVALKYENWPNTQINLR